MAVSCAAVPKTLVRLQLLPGRSHARLVRERRRGWGNVLFPSALVMCASFGMSLVSCIVREGAR